MEKGGDAEKGATKTLLDGRRIYRELSSSLTPGSRLIGDEIHL